MCKNCQNVEEFIKDCGGTYFKDTEFQIYHFKCQERNISFIVLLPEFLTAEQVQVLLESFNKILFPFNPPCPIPQEPRK
jgi:hypothetical protein